MVFVVCNVKEFESRGIEWSFNEDLSTTNQNDYEAVSKPEITICIFLKKWHVELRRNIISAKII